jgi:hypothetical protein
MNLRIAKVLCGPISNENEQNECFGLKISFQILKYKCKSTAATFYCTILEKLESFFWLKTESEVFSFPRQIKGREHGKQTLHFILGSLAVCSVHKGDEATIPLPSPFLFSTRPHDFDTSYRPKSAKGS